MSLFVKSWSSGFEFFRVWPMNIGARSSIAVSPSAVGPVSGPSESMPQYTGLKAPNRIN